MDLGLGSLGLALGAGALSTLSPCVLPIVPILLASAANAHPRAPLALAAGLASSYALVGSVLAWAGSTLGVDVAGFRLAGALMLGVLGLVLLSSAAQRGFATATARIGDAGNWALSRLQLDGVHGQFVIGATLGVVWSPCVGPTLGAAAVLASHAGKLPQVAAIMAAFGVGAAAPIVALAYASRAGLASNRATLLRVGHAGKLVMGAALLVVALLIVLGGDKDVEAWLVENSPMWLTQLTTRF